jgi:hypothetical protein
MAWKRDPFRACSYVLLIGFNTQGQILSQSTIEIIENIHGLCSMIDATCMCGKCPITRSSIDDAQAWNESMIVNALARPDTNIYTETLLFAMYACTYNLSTDLWQNSFVPAHCASRLLGNLQRLELEDAFGFSTDFLLWLICVGGAFSTEKQIRASYVALIGGRYSRLLDGDHNSWSMIQPILGRFLWCDTKFTVPFSSFWKEVAP